MKRILIALLTTLILLAFPPIQATAQDSSPVEPDSGAVVCPPGVYITSPGDCLPLGPSAYLTGLAQLGMTFPPRPLPASKPDPSLTQLPYHYFHLMPGESVPIYSSPGEKGPGAQQFPPGFVYISYVDQVSSNGIYFLMQNGGWIPGKGERPSEIPKFQGLIFQNTPRNSFGWVAFQTPIMSAPGYTAGKTGQEIYTLQTVQIYNSQTIDGMEWYLIGPDQWAEGRNVARVTPNPIPPDGVTNGRWIDVNLAKQTLAAYDNYKLVFATMVATGQEPFWTRPGLFQIQQKKETETMRNNDLSDFYYLDNVPWTMYFDGVRALHGAYWRTHFGYAQSHGCVNLSVGDAHWLFNWAHEGDWVYVHDPSGLTPTDPALYIGGAY
jgi:lipoprotein-anchoring transpeptidase ErfK/SrfK